MNQLCLCSSDWIAYKALIAPGPKTVDMSVKKNTAKGLVSGSYTFHRETVADCSGTCHPGWTIIPQASSVNTLQGCLNLCDLDKLCAGVGIIGLNADAITKCKLIKGDTTPGTFKRTVTKTDVARLGTSTLHFTLAQYSYN